MYRGEGYEDTGGGEEGFADEALGLVGELDGMNLDEGALTKGGGGDLFPPPVAPLALVAVAAALAPAVVPPPPPLPQVPNMLVVFCRGAGEVALLIVLPPPLAPKPPAPRLFCLDIWKFRLLLLLAVFFGLTEPALLVLAFWLLLLLLWRG